MNSKRIQELEAFVNDFNSELKSAFDIYSKKNADNLEKMNKTQQSLFGIRKTKKTFSNTLFEETKPWIPNDGVGHFFGQFQTVTPRNDLNSWEILRVKNMIKRSYARQPEFLNQRDMYPSNSVGRLFEYQAKQNPNILTLSHLGKTIVDKFIDENTKKKSSLREKERQIWNYRHSKPHIEINPWKFSNHVIKEFSRSPVDKAYIFRIQKKTNYLQEPFKIPKKEGDYFDPQVKGL